VANDTAIEPDLNELAGLYRAIKTLSKEAKTELRTDVAAISAWTVPALQKSAGDNPYPRQVGKALQTARAVKRRDATVLIGGAKKMQVSRKITENNPAPNATQLLFGGEFGAIPTSENGQFPNGGRRFPMTNKGGYGIFPTLKTLQPEITRRWKSAVDNILNKWSKG
jgi:hypothetical protein